MPSTSSLSRPPKVASSLQRVAILFAGGPAPAANAVISTAASAFLRNGIEVIGIRNGYSRLLEYSPDHPLEEGTDYIKLQQNNLKRSRNSRGILLGTSRANPGEKVKSPADLTDPEKIKPLHTVRSALQSLGVGALISIGGDDTLKTANKFKRFQDHLPESDGRIRVVHVPKTIDNDYSGIDFTFGYFTAVETFANEILNLLADAEATKTYYLVETMGRSAGWLAYGASIAGEASLVIGLEDITGEYRTSETVRNPVTGKDETREIMDLDKVVGRIVATMKTRDQEGKPFGVIVIAEGLAKLMPSKVLEGIPHDEHGHIAIVQVDVGRRFARLVGDRYKEETKKSRKITGLQLGYEARCGMPHAFDVMLGSQLGVGAYRALVEENRDGVMISITGLLNLKYVPFEDLVDPETLVTNVRFVPPDSDFHRLARFLETYVPE